MDSPARLPCSFILPFFGMSDVRNRIETMTGLNEYRLQFYKKKQRILAGRGIEMLQIGGVSLSGCG